MLRTGRKDYKDSDMNFDPKPLPAFFTTPKTKNSVVKTVKTENTANNRINTAKHVKLNNFKIIVSPKNFGGSERENINVWIFQYEQCMIINCIDKSSWTQLAFPYLIDNAAVWYLSFFSKSTRTPFELRLGKV